MRAIGYTVFSSNKGIEPFELEILGQMKNHMGPGQDLIVVRLLGKEFANSGVVAGMSGSPVYVNGKLLGALSYGFGRFTKEPIGGVTPIANMLRDTQLPELSSANLGFDMKPIALSLVAQGLSPEVARSFGNQLHERGLSSPVLAAGNFVPETRQASSLVPGGAFSAMLIGGDMSLACIGTVTYVDQDRFVGLGHSFLQNGKSELPVANAEIVTTVFGQDEPYKMGQPLNTVGVLLSDRSSGVTGLMGKKPSLIPMQVKTQSKTWHYQISRAGKESIFFASMALSNSLSMTPEHEAGGTYRLKARIKLQGQKDFVYERVFAAGSHAVDSELSNAFLEPLVLLQNQDRQVVLIDAIETEVIHSSEVQSNRLLGFTVFAQPRPHEILELDLYSQHWKKSVQKHHVVLNMPFWNLSEAYSILAVDRVGTIALEKEFGLESEGLGYEEFRERLETVPGDTETCFYLKESTQGSNFMGYSLTDLPISLKETLTEVRSGSEVSLNTKVTRLGCVDLGSVVTGKVLKDYGEKKQS